MNNQQKIKLNDENWASLKYGLAKFILKNAFSNNKLNHKIKPFETIYHYTDINGLIAILESQSFFCTNINFLNDRKEFNHGVEIVKQNINSITEKTGNNEILKYLKTEIDSTLDIDRYVTCFSKNGDLLSQWRSYGNEGKGIAIGFAPHDMEDSIADQVFGMDIVYSPEIQNGIIEEYLKIIPEYFKQNKELFDWGNYNYDYLVAKSTIEFLEGAIATFKHPSFIEEEEFRIEYKFAGVLNKSKEKTILFRSSENLIIPYVELISKFTEDQEIKKINPEIEEHTNFGAKLPLKEIILGPSLDFEINKIGIEKLLNKTNYKNIKIRQSAIPYRI
jgi:hypothetical protein